PKERYGFVINNARLIRDVAKRMDTADNEYRAEQMDLLNDYTQAEPFILRTREGYPDTGQKKAILEKNIYGGYSESNWVKQSGPEKLFEYQINGMGQIDHWYRSKDSGHQYFSIAYNNDNREFFPDYLVKDKNGTTYIIETKGGEGANIDEYAEQKFYALKRYVESDLGGDEKFAFVRPSKDHQGVLMYNNTEWDDNVDDSPNWKLLQTLFMEGE
ncbi:MAG: restriction endonuclease subunit R, partial [Lactobacillaceae bacterium]|nr:restriction endonuclease subunit R [Lactobacillaceae bacterium]